MNKICTTCKFEPEWDEYNNGYCKIIPERFIGDEWTLHDSGDVYIETLK